MKVKKLIEPTLHVLIWGLGYVFLLKEVNTIGSFSKADGTIFYPITLGTFFNILMFYFIALVLIPRYSKDKKTGVFIFITATIFIGFSIAETFIDHLFFVNYYSSELESIGTELIVNCVINGFIFSFSIGYGFTRNWLLSERLRIQLKEEKLKAELNFLKAQINPHFLFNVLNMAFATATKSGDEPTADIIERLSGLMRYMLYESNEEKVELEKEINYIKNFIALHKKRLASDIPVKINFDVLGDTAPCKIAPLILIPFVENAFKYGIKLESTSEISIKLKVNNNQVNFSVDNTINEVNNSMNSKNSGIGLENVIKRLSLLYPDKYALEKSEHNGIFSIKLNIKLN